MRRSIIPLLTSTELEDQERHLLIKVLNRVLFKPYSREQIATIINVFSPPPPHAQQRLDALAVFSPEAIDLCSRKVSAVSGDIRRALMIAKRGVELAAEREADT